MSLSSECIHGEALEGLCNGCADEHGPNARIIRYSNGMLDVLRTNDDGVFTEDPLGLEHARMMREADELETWRAGYAQALFDSGPRPTSEEDERKFRLYYRDAAAKRSPTP